MQIFVEKIENPNQEFWIWKKEITNRQTEDIYPSAISNVGSGISAAIYQKDEAGHVTQIAQLQLPDYDKRVEYPRVAPLAGASRNSVDGKEERRSILPPSYEKFSPEDLC